MKSLSRLAFAKINLTLDVLGKLENGYHAVSMVMQTVGLFDQVTVSLAYGGGIRLTCSRDDLPADETNLAYRAAALFYEETKKENPGTEIKIKKNIPMAAGLAGGSTDAAAVLRALDTLHETHLSDDALCAMGLKLGADVPYCLLGGTMLAEGIGEKLTRLAPAPACTVVLCKPNFAISTAEIYRKMDTAENLTHPDNEGMRAALTRGDLDGVCERLCNVMEQVTGGEHPEIGEIRRAMEENGASGTAMSGSGPTVFGLFRDRAAADRARDALIEAYPETFVTRIRNVEG
jgi:4-diphosphocytidyl-2-C-methyl-D-erythritol kinase